MSVGVTGIVRLVSDDCQRRSLPLGGGNAGREVRELCQSQDQRGNSSSTWLAILPTMHAGSGPRAGVPSTCSPSWDSGADGRTLYRCASFQRTDGNGGLWWGLVVRIERQIKQGTPLRGMKAPGERDFETHGIWWESRGS